MSDNLRLNLDIDTAKTLMKLTETKNLNSFASFMNVSELIQLEKLNETLNKKLSDDEIGKHIKELPTKIM